MGVKWTTTKDRLPEIESIISGLKGRKVQVSASKTDSWLAAIHEYGCRITVTPKMRAYLHANGLHLKDSTTEIIIPERSFMRTGHDENADRIIAQTERALAQVVGGKMSIDDFLDLYGQQMVTAIKTFARDLNSPPNHPYTVEQKGSSNPLVDTGQMIESITWRKTGI